MTPQRIQRKRTPGYNMQAASPNGLPVVSVTRPGPYGNPFFLDSEGMIWIHVPKDYPILWSDPGVVHTVEDVVDLHRQWMQGKLDWASFLPPPPDLTPLRDKNVACFCRIDTPCHGDNLIELAAL